MFLGRNPSWPSVSNYLKMKIGSSVVRDLELGLAIVTCSKTKHSDGERRFIHVPRNPCGSFSEMNNDLVSSNFTGGIFSDGIEMTSGHYMLTNQLQMRNKIAVDSTVCVAWQKNLTYIHSKVREKNLPLLYPLTYDGAPVGALRSVFYSEYGNIGIENGYASLVDHIRVRLKDQTLLTSKNKKYITWSFDCYMNKLLNNYVSAIAAKKKTLDI